MTATALIEHAVRAVALEARRPDTPAGDGRTVMVRLVRYGVASRVSDDGGRSHYMETFAPGSVRAQDGALVYLETPRSQNPHLDRPALVGRIVGYRSLDDGAYADVRIADTGPGRDLLAMIDDRLMQHVSMEFDAPTLPRAGQRADTVVHTEATVTGLLFTNTPQSTGADVLGRRAQPTTGDTAMSETPVAGPFKGTIEGNIDGSLMTPDPVAPVDPNAAPDPNAGRAAPAPAAGRATVTVGQVATGQRSTARRAVTRFESFGQFAHAAAFGAAQVSVEERESVFRALNMARTGRGMRALDVADTGDVTGLLQTQWIFDIIDLMRAYTPTVNAFSSRPLPANGLVISRPVIKVRPAVGKQSADGAALTSTKAEFEPANFNVDTYGGGQEMTIATIQRTDPAYLEAVMRLYAVEMAKAIEAAAAAAVAAAADSVNTVIDLATSADTDLQTAFTASCLPFLTGLGRLPEFALISVGLWQRMANAVDGNDRPLFPTVSPFNPAGSLSLTSPDGQVRDLPFRVAPGIATGSDQFAVVAVPEAFETMVGNVQTLQADVPETLVHGMAVFEFAAMGVVDGAGLVQISPVTP
jgi:hypothetical protein